jgi:hypothetical protein
VNAAAIYAYRCGASADVNPLVFPALAAFYVVAITCIGVLAWKAWRL